MNLFTVEQSSNCVYMPWLACLFLPLWTFGLSGSSDGDCFALHSTQSDIASRLCFFLNEEPLANCSSSQSSEFLGTGKTVSMLVSWVIVAVICSVPLSCQDRSGACVMS